ncbi:hypothetical protein COW46_04680 [Candidatus Gracilibacteria bacterium CG17_big_fil_post_rev_8_21_14_2_50_48_13]|nr:MAG: hypothetical protein COW46_04680 [Candidatus Gracilibacteria bacterium CG17_big_fil_post_rev_8_21_14_2_50_48_13]
MKPIYKHAAGFTLVELTISMGIFVVIFAAMTQIFFLMQGTIARINAEREMTAWVSTITQTIATDLERYAISVEESEGNALVLKRPQDDSTIVYRTKQQNLGDRTEMELMREVKEEGQTSLSRYTSPLFILSDVRMHVSPGKTNPLRCSILPAVALHLEVRGKPGDARLQNMLLPIDTVFSSNENPQSYAQGCRTSTTPLAP